MIPNISLLGHNISAQDFWAFMIVLGTIGGICFAGWFARNGNKALDVISTLVWCGVFISAGAIVCVGIFK